MSVHFLLMFSLLLILESELKVFCSKNILSILGFSCIIAVIALLALGLTQNKALPENVKVIQTPECVCVCVCVCVHVCEGPWRGQRERGVTVNQSSRS